MIKAILLSLLLFFTISIDAKTYTFGIVPQYSTTILFNIWEPIMNEMQKQLNIKIELRIPKNIETFEDQLNNGVYDFAYMNPYHYIIANKKQGYIPLVKDRSKSLQGILVINKKSKIKSVLELDGKKVAFPSPNALGASLLMRTILAEDKKIKIIPVYVRSHSSVYMNVALDRYPAGGGVKGTFNRQIKTWKKYLKILFETPKLAPHPICSNPRVSKDVNKAATNFFIGMANSKKGLQLLSKIPMTQPGVSNIQDYLPLKKYNLEKYYTKIISP